MFERFTAEARDVVLRAQEETRALGHAWIGAEHLLLSVLARPAVAGAGGLAALGLTYGQWKAALLAARELEPGLGTSDEVALSSLGIDLAEVRRRVEAGFGPGALEQAAPEAEQRGRGPWRRQRATEAGPAKPQGAHPVQPGGEEGAGAVPAGGTRAAGQAHRRRARAARDRASAGRPDGRPAAAAGHDGRGRAGRGARSARRGGLISPRAP